MGYSNNLYFFVILFLVSFSWCVSQPTCPVSSCDPYTPKIRFPFRITGKQDVRCGYPGFDLHCDPNNRTILILPNAGEFTVQRIDYEKQFVFINDPSICVAERILHFSYLDSPFTAAAPRKLTFLNCTEWDGKSYDASPVYCLSHSRYTVLVSFDSTVPSGCRFMTEVVAPFPSELNKYHPNRVDLYKGFQLTWTVPDCSSCEKKGGICGFKDYTRLEISCFHLPQGVLKKIKYGLIIGLGVPGLVWLIGVACYICGKVRDNGETRTRLNLQNIEIMTVTQPTITVSGLDSVTIESYPKTIVEETQALHNLNNVVCPICLVEYQPKETVRIIPECNHYFHVNCIDEWLRLNSSCPVCRKSLMGVELVAV